MFFALLLLSVSGTLFVSFDSMLDPLDIHWPDGWVFNMVEFTSNHAGDSAYVHVNCNIPIILPVDTYVEIDLGFANAYYITLDAEQPSKQDNIFKFNVGTLPSAGTYGPISLVVRESANGQILAARESLGFIAILASAPAGVSSSLVVVNTGSSFVASASTTLKFTFTLNGDLYPGDYFYIDFDSSFGVKSLSIAWDEADTSTATQYLNSTGLEVVENDDGTLIVGAYIYGIQNVVASNLVACFSLSGFTNPPYAKSGNGYSWSVEAYRFGTVTKLQKYLGSTPTAAITAGAVTVSSWTPSNGVIDIAKIAKDSILYMTLTFSITHEIGAAGTIVIDYTGVALNDIAYNPLQDQVKATITGDFVTFINSDQLDCITCVLTSATKVTCTVIADKTLPASSVINVYTLTHFSSSASTATVSAITTAYNSNTLDTLATAKSLTLQVSTVSTLLTEPISYFTPLSGDISTSFTAASGDADLYGLYLAFPTAVVLSASQVVNVNLPIQKVSTACDFDIAFGTSAEGMYPTTNDDAAVTDWENVAVALTNSLTMATVTTGKIAITLVSTYAASDYINLVVASGSTALTAGSIIMPNFVTGVYSMHEITVSMTVSSVFYYYSKPFYVTVGSAATVVLTPACSNAGIPGAVGMIAWTTFAYTPSSGYTAFVDFTIVTTDATIGGDFGSGLASGSVYPSSGAGNGNTLTIEYDSTDTAAYTTHLMLEYGTSVPLTETDIYVPLLSFVLTETYILSSTLYSIRTTDGAKFILSTATAATITGIATAAVSPDVVSGTDTPIAQSTSAEISSFQFSVLAADLVASSGTVGVTFDYGYFLSSSASIKVVSTTQTSSATALTILSSLDPYFEFLSGYATKSISAEDTAFIITGVTIPWFEVAIANAYLYSFTTIGTCINQVDVPIAVTMGDSAIFTSVSLSPLTAVGLGATQQTIDISLTFVLPGVVYALPDISFKATIGTQYHGSVSGLIWELSAGNYYNAQGTMSGNTFDSITNYADVNDDNVVDNGKITTMIPSGTSVTITVFSVPVPSVAAAAIYAGFDSVYVTSTAGDIFKYIDSTSGVDASTRTSYSVNIDPSKSGISYVYVFPDVQGSSEVQFEMSFKAAQILPAGTKITIQGETFVTDTIVDQNTWCSFGFESAAITSGNLVITTNARIPANTVVYIRKDLAFNIGVSATVSPIFMLTATYGGATILQDDATDATLKTLTYVVSPTETVSSSSITIEYNNQGINSWHTFSLTLSADTAADWFFCFEAPIGYNAHPGPSVQFEANPNVNYYTVVSSLSDEVYCYGEHWLISCAGVGVVSAGTAIDFSIYIDNAAVSTADWSLYVIDSEATLVIAPEYSITATYTGIPDSNIDLYYVNHDPVPSESTDLEFNALIDGTYEASSGFIIVFPHPYELSLYNPDIVICSAVYETDTPNEFVASGTSCTVSDNFVIFSIATSVELTSDYWSTFTIAEISDPLDGIRRDDEYFDNADEDLFDVYNFWTGKFTFLGIQSDMSTATVIDSISYDNLNAAYTGYYFATWEPLIVNDGHDLIVTQGTFSEFYTISTKDGILWAYYVDVTASDDMDDVLEFSDSGSYTLTWDYPEAYFRVGVPPTAFDGFYYISWTIDESSFISGSYYYGKPPKTRVQSFMSNQITIDVGEISSAVPGLGTFPIELKLGGVTPFTNLKVNFELTTATDNITFVPNPVVFTDVDTVMYFSIVVESSATIGTTYDFTYSLSGDDADSFTIDTTGQFTVDTITSELPTITVVLEIISQTEANLNVDVGYDSVVYWALVATDLYDMDSNWTSLETIKAYAAPLVGSASGNQTTIYDQFSFWDEEKNDIEIGDDWAYYTFEVLSLASEACFFGIELVPQGSYTVISFDNLIASTSFTAAAWADNFSGNKEVYAEDTQSTSDLASPCYVELDFADTLSSDDYEKIKLSEAQTMGIAKGRVVDYNGFSRRLGSVASTLVLATVTSSITPNDAVNSMSSADLADNLAAQGISSTFTLASGIVTSDMFPSPSFTTSAFTDDGYVVTFNFTIAIDGSVACVTEYNPDDSYTETSYYVYYGYERTGAVASSYNAADYASGDSDSWTWNYTDITDFGNYVTTCTVCNNYPILPECIADSDLIVSNFTWTNVTTSSGMNLLVGMLSALLVYLA